MQSGVFGCARFFLRRKFEVPDSFDGAASIKYAAMIISGCALAPRVGKSESSLVG